jgi:hypothetical protein
MGFSETKLPVLCFPGNSVGVKEPGLCDLGSCYTETFSEYLVDAEAFGYWVSNPVAPPETSGRALKRRRGGKGLSPVEGDSAALPSYSRRLRLHHTTESDGCFKKGRAGRVRGLVLRHVLGDRLLLFTELPGGGLLGNPLGSATVATNSFSWQ